MKTYLKKIILFITVGPLLFAASAFSQTSNNKYYGEPIQLKSRYIYFTSWKYVKQGNFCWTIHKTEDQSEDKKLTGSWLQGDGKSPATFKPIDMPRRIRLVTQQATKEPFKPGRFAATVFDQGKYKTWYTISPCPNPEPFSTKDQIMPGHNSYIAYTESKDSIKWETPKLGLFEYAGNRENSIVFRGDLNGSSRGWHGGSVFVDPSSKEERYKMIYLGSITDQEWDAFEKKYPYEIDTMARRPDVGGYRCVHALFGAVSPDGIHWKSLPEPLMIQHADTLNTCYYDLDLKKYVAYIRTWQVNERVPDLLPANSTTWISVGRRSIGRAVSDDFRHFSKAEIVVSTGADMPPSHVWYSNGKTNLPGCPDNHVMFPWLWELERDGGSVWLLSSPDGWVWSKVPGGPVIQPSNPGQPDGGYVSCSGNLIEYPGDKWGIPYGGVPIPHKYPGRDINKRKGLFPGIKGVSGLATWPKGRLVALQCDQEGEFTTVAFIPPGDKLRLNAVIPPTGYIKVEVALFGSNNQIPGRSFDQTDPLVGDNLDFPLTWKGQSELKHNGKPIRLRFKMKQAKLFAIEFY